MSEAKTTSGKKLKHFLPFKLSESLKKMSVTNLQVDSRKIVAGDMFVAYPGAVIDGRSFVEQAVVAGAHCVLAETATNAQQQQWVKAALDHEGCELIEVDGLQGMLGDIANRFYDSPSEKMDVIAVTGTNGKTTVTQLIAQAMLLQGQQPSVIGTLGNGSIEKLEKTDNTTPGALEVHRMLSAFLEKGSNTVALEASSHGLEQGRLQGVSIDTAVVTNVSRDHLDYHGTMKAYRKAKELLVKWPDLQHAVLNMDDPNVAAMKEKIHGSVRFIGYSRNEKTADLFASDIEYFRDGTRFQLHFEGKEVPLNTRLLGDFNIDNILAVCAVLLLRGVSITELSGLVSQLIPIHGRMEIVELETTQKMPVVVVDYAHTPDALAQSLAAMRRHCEGALWCVFGCGGDRDQGKRSLMGEVAAAQADHIVLTNDNPRTEKPEIIISDIETGFAADIDYIVNKDRKLAIQDAVLAAESNDWILLAGKGHEDYQEINGVRHSFSDFKQARKALKKRLQNLESSCT
ncbi:MAG: UDP-N-acetylmuramoyl-L-alanyl-D-glutamate--2,6-diaminopimelate ligase [Pseudomonadales bacterium]|nr:UDP-N-acetylmuramoyl-L-alanyl-D-glutamate--2,6-diaminopimelate ligase [Pseudomonadales bacterium]